MKILSIIGLTLFLIVSKSASFAQIKNLKTESIKIYGNCSICKENIEKTGNVKKLVKVDWDKESKIASISYNAKLTNKAAILKRIALAGYDSDSFLAPDLAYSKLKECCQYERVAKKMPSENILADKKNTLPSTETTSQNTSMNDKKESQMQIVFNDYFKLKDALVNTDANAASAKATDLMNSLAAIKMNELAMDVHMVWMKVMADLNTDTKHIADSKKIDQQREHFIALSKNIYALIKVAKSETPTYYQYCPMANEGKGANWLSKENVIRNPYFGSEMMNCGKVVETIKL